MIRELVDGAPRSKDATAFWLAHGAQTASKQERREKGLHITPANI